MRSAILSLCAAGILASAAIAADVSALRSAVVSRQSALSNLSAQATITTANVPADGGDWLVPATWRPIPRPPVDLKIDLARPAVRIEISQAGDTRRPVVDVIRDGAILRDSIAWDGKRVHLTSRRVSTEGIYKYHPILDVLDVQLLECVDGPVTLLSLVDAPGAQVTQREGGGWRLAVRLDLSEWVKDFDVEFDELATPLRMEVVTKVRENAAPPYTHRLVALRTVEFQGARIAVDSVGAVFNPSVASEWQVRRIVLDGLRAAPELAAETFSLEPDRRDAYVHTRHIDGRHETETYDANGVRVAQSSYYPDFQLAPGEQPQSWVAARVRPWVPALCIAAAAFVGFVAIRRSRCR